MELRSYQEFASVNVMPAIRNYKQLTCLWNTSQLLNLSILSTCVEKPILRRSSQRFLLGLVKGGEFLLPSPYDAYHTGSSPYSL